MKFENTRYAGLMARGIRDKEGRDSVKEGGG
jgi:hypothetical protein